MVNEHIFEAGDDSSYFPNTFKSRVGTETTSVETSLLKYRGQETPITHRPSGWRWLRVPHLRRVDLKTRVSMVRSEDHALENVSTTTKQNISIWTFAVWRNSLNVLEDSRSRV